jgi:hypothetical protein
MLKKRRLRSESIAAREGRHTWHYSSVASQALRFSSGW